ncbi:alpha/beta hydrolase fold-domain-containing protein [Collybia nuda]|uniref:Alpha/beta hydrolase fold-domain-containing protein n=1 Tax=Collybia nuda TaxID=64659 RepID=A0A9P6CIS9_9AGAR|nr:alpha/beta hydrolase fold-domain-containing protein [Collybia nuda]
MTEKVPKQPLHPSVVSKLDPEYVEFHNSTLQYITPPHTLPWDPALRNAPAVPGGSLPLPVAKIEDFDLKYTKFRAFTPQGTAPAAGWPVLIYFHGGGWTLGNIGSETGFTTNMSVRAKCVVISVDYRLAPEDPYPAAVEDAIDSLNWVVEHGKAKLNLDTSKIAVGGSSSGGNLATILALKAAEANPPIPLFFQLLIVPVTDNTASISNYWKVNQYTPWLGPERMSWFRNNYLPNKEDWTKWDASPMFAPKELLRKVPKAWIGIAGMDILREEGIEYGKKMQQEGVEVETEIYEGGPHPIMAMDGVLTIGKKLVTDAANALGRAFGTA